MIKFIPSVPYIKGYYIKRNNVIHSKNYKVPLTPSRMLRFILDHYKVHVDKPIDVQIVDLYDRTTR